MHNRNPSWELESELRTRLEQLSILGTLPEAASAALEQDYVQNSYLYTDQMLKEIQVLLSMVGPHITPAMVLQTVRKVADTTPPICDTDQATG